MFAKAAVKQFLRYLYYPLVLRRNQLAGLICRELRGSQGEPLQSDDLSFVQSVALECVDGLESAPLTLRGAVQRQRQSVILRRYEIKGEPRELIASELGVSLRQFYRERETALRLFAESLADRVLAGSHDVRELSGAVPVLARALPDHALERLREMALIRETRRNGDLAQGQA